MNRLQSILYCLAVLVSTVCSAEEAANGKTLQLTLPSEFYAVPDVEVSIYFDNVVLTKTPDAYRFDVNCDIGQTQSRRWSVTPSAKDVGTHDLSIEVSNPGGKRRATKFTACGYVVVNANLRGRFESGGEWDPFSPKHKTDGYDLVQWIAEQSWCNGNVGTYGLSYMGWTTWWTASQAPPALKAIVPEVAPPDYFRNCPYQNGIFVC